jgi:hypothetical protein
MKRTFAFTILAGILLTSCTNAPPTFKTEQFTVQYTSASIPWLANLYNCAGTNVIADEQRAADFLDLESANMVIRIGSPGTLDAFAYQIGTDDLLVIVNAKNPTRTLTAEQARELFSGQIQNWKAINGNDMPVQVWIFPAGEDVQEIFDQTVLAGSPVTSDAHLTTNPDEMAQAVGKDVSAIGIITGRWKTGNINSVYTAASSLPVLAITLSKPQGTLAHILACMQK